MSKDFYDVITKRVISGTNIELAKLFKIDPSCVSHARRGRQDSISDRFCLLSRKEELIFELKNSETQEIYECLTPMTLFIHLGIEYSDNEGKYVYELRKRRQEYASIGKYLISIKDPKKPYTFCSKNSIVVDTENKKRKLESKIASRLRTRIGHLVRSNGFRKSDSTERLLGCSIDFFMGYIEALFLDGMSWENYGVNEDNWHIDHIKPCNTFDLFDEEEQQRCFHYTNLRPLWSKDNLRRPKDGSDVPS